MGGKYLPPGMFWDHKGWEETLTGIVNEHLVPRAEAVAKACNDQSADDGGHQETTTEEERRGYVASVDDSKGGKVLQDGTFRATVITATYPAMADNARTNRLVNNFHLAESEE